MSTTCTTATHIVSTTVTTTNADSAPVATAPITAPSARARTAHAPRATTPRASATTAPIAHAPHVHAPTATARPASTPRSCPSVSLNCRSYSTLGLSMTGGSNSTSLNQPPHATDQLLSMCAPIPPVTRQSVATSPTRPENLTVS